ncbi:hypothetical protein [Fodinibius sediminis]|uniref:Uncharacterized protein n=1 Tax=Fodinibius sediminis TaxID=1214077 RepID=A0A521CH33_9BACT|nr:hypothetical protein [Fodinibius sediminis]SMO58655.1 hypothetical protein SAMN06265218_10672 [Fodinibius sediminis]
MKIYRTIVFSVVLVLATSAFSYAQSGRGSQQLKTYVNDVVQKVEEAETSDEKRAILNTSFDKMIKAFDRVSSMPGISETDKEGIAVLREDIEEKRSELNGADGYEKVPDRQLNNFAQYVQQDIEQADSITIGVTTLLLIIIILLLI